MTAQPAEAPQTPAVSPDLPKIRRHEAVMRGLVSVRELAEHPSVTGTGVGAIGFSFGGFQLLRALDDSTLPLNRLVGYYAVYPLPERHVPVLAHFAGKDDFETDEDMAEMARALADAGGPNASFSYPGTAHWFAEADRPEFDPAAARLAFDRTVEFLRG